MTAAQTPTNRLAGTTSPYLLQHAHNPVEWQPWGPEALEQARCENKPILLSVGYAACHWCHVMAHESFEDPATAEVMNELFVNIKVDREERPDIDQIYMNALHLLGEQGGWPLTMFLTPNAEPVWGGTYFPKESRFGRPAFVDVLREMARLFRDEPHKITRNRDALLTRLAARAAPHGKVMIGLKQLDSVAAQVANMFDSVNGGLRGAPKFPQASLLEFLWRAGMRTGDARFFETVEHTLEHICEGGIYDHLGGGFSRYSVDEKWLVPHFEKMLYDNAQLLELLALAWQKSGRALFADRAHETVHWLEREMIAGEGGFAASLDADSEGEEGKFYVWSLAEIEAAIGADAADFAAEYDVSIGGNFEENNILNHLKHLPRSNEIHAAAQEDAARFSMLRGKLLEIRNKRIRPGCDDKVLADWNGLMITALVHAGIILNQPTWIVLARRVFDFITRALTQGDRLGHSWRAGQTLYPGLASDYATMIRAALTLYEHGNERDLLDQALRWQRALDAHYADSETGRYYLSADDAADLLLRPDSTTDEATPNVNAVAAGNLVRLAVFTGEDQWRNQADRLIENILSAEAQNLFGHVALLNALDLRLRAAEIVVTGPEVDRLAAAALKLPYLDRIVLRVKDATDLPALNPVKTKLNGVAGNAAFVCVAERCSLPVIDPSAIAPAVAAMRGAIFSAGEG